MKEFETDRLYIRSLKENDYIDLFPLHSNPNVMRYIREPDKNMDQTRSRMNQMLSYSKSNPDFGLFLAFEKETSDLIGWSLFLHAELNIDNPIEVGYRLFPEKWGKGYATELTKMFVNYGLNILKLKRICAVTDPEHEKSKHVLVKSGLRYIDKREFYGHECSYFEVLND